MAMHLEVVAVQVEVWTALEVSVKAEAKLIHVRAIAWWVVD